MNSDIQNAVKVLVQYYEHEDPKWGKKKNKIKIKLRLLPISQLSGALR